MTRKIFSILLMSCLLLQQVVAVTKDEAKAMVLAGRYAEALPHLERLVKQNRRSGAQWYLAIARQHLYDFSGAIEAIESYREVLHSEDWINRADSLLELCQLGERALEHTLDVVVIDSMMVPRDSFFEYYRLGPESGHIVKSEQGLYYENPGADHRIFSDGKHLSECHRYQNDWEDRHELAGLGTSDFTLQYPFLRTDGQTLYFACDSLPGLGGYDIYRTTYDAEGETYYQPERLGMPFNSSADDYMMAIDETHQVGWWATNRNAPADSVTIYLFLFDDEPVYLDEPTVSRARLDCIAETWRNPEGYASLVESVLNASQTVEVVEQLHIVVSDGMVYKSESDFRSPKALEAYRKSQQLAEQISALESDMAAWRKQYAAAKGSQRESLRGRISTAEAQLPALYRRQRESIILMRRLESEALIPHS